jgi:hypothetical protein
MEYIVDIFVHISLFLDAKTVKNLFSTNKRFRRRFYECIMKRFYFNIKNYYELDPQKRVYVTKVYNVKQITSSKWCFVKTFYNSIYDNTVIGLDDRITNL